MANADSPSHQQAIAAELSNVKRSSFEQRFTFGDLHHRQSEASSHAPGLTSPSPHDLESLGLTGKKASGAGIYDGINASANKYALKLEDLSNSLDKSLHTKEDNSSAAD